MNKPSVSLWLLVLLSGCATADVNRLMYGTPQGFLPETPVRRAPQPVWSNLPDDRIARLTREVSQVTPQHWGPINVVVGPNTCSMCATGTAVYVDPGFVSSFTDQELLAALAHEMAHTALGHTDRNVLVGQLVDLTFRAVASHQTSPRTVQVLDLTHAFMRGQFSQIQEREADRQGAAYLDALGYDGTAAMTSALVKLQAMGKDHWPSWFATHPSEEVKARFSCKRIAAIDTLVLLCSQNSRNV